MFSQETFKCAAELITAKRKNEPIYSGLEELIHGEDELRPPTKADFKNFEKIMNQMVRARPYQLGDVKVLSGPVDPKILADATKARKKEDTWFERMGDLRNFVSQEYMMMYPEDIEESPTTYHPYSNAVIINNRSPGSLIHELGHGIDLSRAEGQSNSWRKFRNTWKPELLEEFDAWSKGRGAYREGFLADTNEALDGKADAKVLNKELEQYLDNVQKSYRESAPALGTYIGSTAGKVTGGILGGAAAALPVAATMALSGVRNNPLFPAAATISAVSLPVGVMLGSLLGGDLGTALGGQIGKNYSDSRDHKTRERESKELLKGLKLPKDPVARDRFLNILAATVSAGQEKK